MELWAIVGDVESENLFTFTWKAKSFIGSFVTNVPVRRSSDLGKNR